MTSFATPVMVRPTPRALLEGLDGKVMEAASGIFPTERRIHVDEQVYDGEWDVLVTTAEHVGHDARLHTVAFGASSSPPLLTWLGGNSQHVTAAPAGSSVSLWIPDVPTPARDLEVPSGLPADVERLVREDLVPGFHAGQPRLPLRVSACNRFGHTTQWIVEPDDHVDPFLLASDGSILAGRVRRSTEEGDAGTQLWVLPAWVSRPREWVTAAWSEWSRDAPNSCRRLLRGPTVRRGTHRERLSSRDDAETSRSDGKRRSSPSTPRRTNSTETRSASGTQRTRAPVGC